MILYYQILGDGNGVKVYKHLFGSRVLTQEEFARKGKTLDKGQIMEKIPAPYNKKIIALANRVNEITNMKLSPFGVKYDNGSKIYCVGNCDFLTRESEILTLWKFS